MQKKIIIQIIEIIFLVGAIVFFLRYYIEPRTIFYPIRPVDPFPGGTSLKFEDIFFTTADGIRLNAWFIPVEDPEYTILFCHGNAGNIGHRTEKIKFFNSLGCSVFIFDYRGYGRSEGNISESGLYKDTEAAYKYLVSRGISGNRIIGYGESIGGAAIIDLALKQDLKAVIIDSAFTSVKDIAGIMYPLVPYWIFSSRFDSEAKIREIRIPKLIIHSLNDEIVPYRLGKKLYDAAAGPKEFLQIKGSHNTNYFESQDLLRQKIGEFIANLPSR